MKRGKENKSNSSGNQCERAFVKIFFNKKKKKDFFFFFN